MHFVTLMMLTILIDERNMRKWKFDNLYSTYHWKSQNFELQNITPCWTNSKIQIFCYSIMFSYWHKHISVVYCHIKVVLGVTLSSVCTWALSATEPHPQLTWQLGHKEIYIITVLKMSSAHQRGLGESPRIFCIQSISFKHTYYGTWNRTINNHLLCTKSCIVFLENHFHGVSFETIIC